MDAAERERPSEQIALDLAATLFSDAVELIACLDTFCSGRDTEATEIKDLIRNSSVEVQSGVKLVSDTGEALKTIECYIVTVNQHMDSIATSAKEQSIGLGEVNTAVN